VKDKKTVLTVSPFKESSQEGQKSLSLCSALHKQRNLYCIHKHYSPLDASSINESIYIQNSFDHGEYDVCVQNINPAFIVKVDQPTLAFYEPQTENQRSYNAQLSLPDFLAVRSQVQKSVLPEEVRDKAFVISPTVWMHNRAELLRSAIGDFIFYVPFLGQTSNMDKIISAYFYAFSKADPVRLAFITQDQEVFNSKFLPEMKRRLRTHSKDSYPPISTYSNVDQMHNEGHCCIDVCSSYEVQFQTLVAFRNCNPAIIMEGSSLDEWCPDGFAYRSPSYSDLVNHESPQALELYSGRESTIFPSAIGLARTMRKAFEDRWGFRKMQKCVTLEAPTVFGDKSLIKTIGEVPCFQ
jgi:hypothetical protein